MALTLTSCSFWERRNSLENENTKAIPEYLPVDPQAKTVPKAQYDELLKRYKALAMTQSIVESTPQGPEGSVHSSESTTLSKTPLEEQIELLKKAIYYFHQKELTKSFNLLRNLEFSDFDVIKVRAKFYIAKLMFDQKSLDLALEIYEEIFEQFPWSGYSLLSLKKLIECAKLLNLPEKSKKYSQIYQDEYFLALGLVTP